MPSDFKSLSNTFAPKLIKNENYRINRQAHCTRSKNGSFRRIQYAGSVHRS